MLFGGLSGGSPGPGAESTWKVLVLLLLLGLAAGCAFLWVWRYAVQV